MEPSQAPQGENPNPNINAVGPEAPSQPVAPNIPTGGSGGPNKKLLYGLIAGAALIIIAAVLIFTLVGKKDNNTNSNADDKQGASKQESPVANDAITASTISEYKIICQGGSVKNAAALDTSKKPYIVYAFEKSRVNQDSWTSVSVGYNEPYDPGLSAQALKTVNVVACLEPVAGTDKVAKTCDFKQDDKTITADYISSQYSLTYYEAQTGKKLGTGDNVPAPATSCPYFAAIRTDENKVYADPDTSSLNAEISKFAV